MTLGKARALFSRFKSLVGGPGKGGTSASAGKGGQTNRLRRRIEQQEREISRLKARSGPADAPPAFFVIGRAKSGTSWLRSILDAHPEILCVNEGRFFGREYRGHGAIPRSLYGALADSEHLTRWVQKSPWSRNEDTEAHVRNLTRHVIDYFMAEKLAKSGKRLAGDKTPLIGMDVVEEISSIHPNAKVIHIVRDGRDVAISSMHHIWNNARDRGGPNDLKPEILARRDAYREEPEAFLARGESIFAEGQLSPTAGNWARLVGKASEDGRALLGENYAEVRYEDLLESPEEETERLLRFLGADAGEEVVRACVDSASFERVSRRKPGEEDSSSFFRKGVAGDWKAVFNEADRRAFKAVAGRTLIEQGYEKDDAW